MKVLIVEDEIMAQRSLVRLLTQNFPEMDIVGTTSSVNSTVAWLRDPANSADVIFMDVELADGICFEIFRQVEVKAKVIMTTAYDSYALKAFEAGSIDYLLKPVDAGALKRAVSRVKASSGGIDVEALMKMMAGAAAAPKKEYKERYIIKFNDRIIPLETSEIAYVYSEEKTNYIVTLDDHHYIIDSSLDVISEELDPASFFRISRGCIVAMKTIKNIVKHNGRLHITATPESAFEMTVSRSRVDDFLTWLEK